MTDAQQKVNALWNGAAEDYDKQPRHGILDVREEAAWQEALRELLPPPPLDVLDAGCGTGFLALLLADLGYHVRAVDLAEKMLAGGREKAAARGLAVAFERGDAIAPPGDAESVDAVVNRHVLWTLTDPPRALASWFRLLRPGGRLLIIDGLWGKSGSDNRLGDIAAAPPVIRLTSLDAVCALVRDAGFAGVTTGTLDEIARVERELHGPSEEEPRYVLTASKPGS